MTNLVLYLKRIKVVNCLLKQVFEPNLSNKSLLEHFFDVTRQRRREGVCKYVIMNLMKRRKNKNLNKSVI